ncbi:MAG: adenosylmethionine decarboxylase [Promethearchaeota archaeon]|nr:MAG: adenosylmethionine decarboxylase [Candidatus Lokiarchaeota archaeon]
MNNEAEEILAVVAEKAQLAEGIEGIRSILLTMYRFPSLKNKKVSQKTGIAIPSLAAVRGELVKAGIIEKRNLLGEKGRIWVKKNLNLAFDYDPLPKEFNNIMKEIPEEFKYLNNLEGLLKDRPIPEFALDQSHADFSTIVKKVLYLLKKGDIEGRKIIFLGDDDVISLALGMTKLADEISVVDIDKRVLEFISQSSENLKYENFNVINHDLRESCPKAIMNKFDVVVMDPPYTIEGLRLFLKRASQVIKSSISFNEKVYPIIGKKCLLSFGNKPPEEMQKLQLSILNHGFIINEMLPDFNHYKGASIIGQFSHLYYLQSIISPQSKYNLNFSTHPIYTSEVKSALQYSFRPVGYHFMGEMHFTGQQRLLDNETIQKMFLDSLLNADLTILDVYHHNYNPYGYSAIAILKTSHAAIHTWPEHGYISIDIFICDEFSKGLEVIKFLKSHLNPIKSEFFFAERGKETTMRYEPIIIE